MCASGLTSVGLLDADVFVAGLAFLGHDLDLAHHLGVLQAAVFRATDGEGAGIVREDVHGGALLKAGNQVFLHAKFWQPEGVLDADVAGVAVVDWTGVHREDHAVFGHVRVVAGGVHCGARDDEGFHRRSEYVADGNVFPGVQDGAFLVEDFHLVVESSVEEELAHRDHVASVERMFGLHAVHADHGGVGVQAYGVEDHVFLRDAHFHVHAGVFVFPRERIFVDEFPVPLVTVDGDVEAVLVVGDAAPHVGGRRGGEEGQPRHEDGWNDVERNLQFSVGVVVAALQREGPRSDLPQGLRFIRRQSRSETSHEKEHDTEGENTDDDGPKQELVIEHRKQCVLSSHWTPSFRASGGPSLSVVGCGNASLSTSF